MDYREGEGDGGGGGDGDYGHAPTTGSDGPRFAAGHYATSRAAGHRDRDRFVVQFSPWQRWRALGSHGDPAPAPPRPPDSYLPS